MCYGAGGAVALMPRIVVDLTIAAHDYVRAYSAPGKRVRVRDREGRLVELPANLFQPFVTHAGVVGSFAISFDTSGKCTGVERLR